MLLIRNIKEATLVALFTAQSKFKISEILELHYVKKFHPHRQTILFYVSNWQEAGLVTRKGQVYFKNELLVNDLISKLNTYFSSRTEIKQKTSITLFNGEKIDISSLHRDKNTKKFFLLLMMMRETKNQNPMSIKEIARKYNVTRRFIEREIVPCLTKISTLKGISYYKL